MLFTEKYRPKSLSQITGQREALRILLQFARARSKRAALIYGPVGVGKTASIYALAQDFNLELVELNAGDFRNKKNIDSIIKNALEQKSLFAKEKIILIDELEGISGNEDRGGIAALNLLLTNKYPIIMITSDPYNPKIKALRKKAELIKFDALSSDDIMRIMLKICDAENIKINADDLKKIALLADGDARAATNDLQAYSGNSNGLGQREKETSILNVLKIIFKSNTFAVTNCLENLSMEPKEIMLWLDENIPLEYKGDEIIRAYHALSKADIFYNRIIRRQNWHFLTYVNTMLTAGIALAKNNSSERIVRYQPVTRLLKIWLANRSEKAEIAESFSKATHCSKRKAMREMPYVEIMMKNNPFIEKELNLNSMD